MEDLFLTNLKSQVPLQTLMQKTLHHFMRVACTIVPFYHLLLGRNVKTEQNLGSNSILNSDPWNIRLLYPEDKEKKLREETIQQLLSIGKSDCFL